MPVPAALIALGKAVISPTAHTIIGASTLAGVTYGNVKIASMDGKIDTINSTTKNIEAKVDGLVETASALDGIDDMLNDFSNDLVGGIAGTLDAFKSSIPQATPPAAPAAPTVSTAPPAPAADAITSDTATQLISVINKLNASVDGLVASINTPPASAPAAPAAPAGT